MQPSKPKAQIDTNREASKTLGLNLEAWLVVFMIFSVFPLINIVALPMVLIIGAILLASYILGRDYSQSRWRRR